MQDLGLIPGSGRSPGERNGNPLQYSCLGNPMVRGAWWASVHGVARVSHDLATKPASPPPLSFTLNSPLRFHWSISSSVGCRLSKWHHPIKSKNHGFIPDFSFPLIFHNLVSKVFGLFLQNMTIFSTSTSIKLLGVTIISWMKYCNGNWPPCFHSCLLKVYFSI